MNIEIGNIYWLMSKSGINHPHVIIKINKDNKTISLCGITTNKAKLSMPNVVVLNMGEANLEKESIVELYNMAIAKKSDLKEYIGTLSKEKIELILKARNLIEDNLKK